MLNSAYASEGKRTLGEVAYEAIREAILSLRLKPGQTVFESELASMLDMSRTPIREAVRTLLVEELIEVLPQRGMKIALISQKKVEETRFVRESLEISAIRKVVAEWDTSKQYYQRLERDLRDGLQEQTDLSSAGDFMSFLHLDEAFHRLLLSSTENVTLVSVVSQMRGHLNRVRALSLEGIGNTDSLLAEHKQLLDAVVSQDEKLAVSVLSAHLSRLRYDIGIVKTQYPTYFRD